VIRRIVWGERGASRLEQDVGSRELLA
jgi:hypothetical protein